MIASWQFRAPQAALGLWLAAVPLAAQTLPGIGPEWLHYHGDQSGRRYSALDQITAANVATLVPVWTFHIRGTERLEVTPLVADGVMYTTSGNRVYALDARSGRVIWEFSRPLVRGVIGDAAGNINRGVALTDDRVIVGMNDCRLVALHRKTGAVLWETVLADYRRGYGITSAPLIANDLALIGTSGGDEGVRGFLSAVDIQTGKNAGVRTIGVSYGFRPLAELIKKFLQLCSRFFFSIL